MYNLGMVAIFEPRISGDRRDIVLKKSIFDSYFYVDAIGFSGGIWILWFKDIWKVDVLACSDFFIHCNITECKTKKNFLFTVVYGSPNASRRGILWNELVGLSSSISGSWVISGDFNACISVEDKIGSHRHDWNAMSQFSDCLNSCNLTNLGCKGPRFTWEKYRLKERIDRACANIQWQTMFRRLGFLMDLCLNQTIDPLLSIYTIITLPIGVVVRSVFSRLGCFMMVSMIL